MSDGPQRAVPLTRSRAGTGDPRWVVAPYGGDDDLAAMLALVRRGDPLDERGVGWMHAGDVVWRLFQNPTIVPADIIRLVRDADGHLAGIIWLRPPGALELFVPPGAGHMDELVRFAIGEGERMLSPDDGAISCEVPTHQAAFGAIVSGCGYRPTGHRPYFCNVQSLAGVEIPEPEREVRAVDPTSGAELDARVAIHREVWAPSKFTREGYDRLRTKPVYRRDLDLVAVTPDGQVAAYAIVWWDPGTRTGEFEPVGTDPRFRRQGYAGAVMREGMRRLQALGAEHAIVLSASGPGSAPANALYRATGFTPAFMLAEWTKPR